MVNGHAESVHLVLFVAKQPENISQKSDKASLREKENEREERRREGEGRTPQADHSSRTVRYMGTFSSSEPEPAEEEEKSGMTSADGTGFGGNSLSTAHKNTHSDIHQNTHMTITRTKITRNNTH